MFNVSATDVLQTYLVLGVGRSGVLGEPLPDIKLPVLCGQPGLLQGLGEGVVGVLPRHLAGGGGLHLGLVSHHAPPRPPAAGAGEVGGLLPRSDRPGSGGGEPGKDWLHIIYL